MTFPDYSFVAAGAAVVGAAAKEVGSFALRKLGVSIVREKKDENGKYTNGKISPELMKELVRGEVIYGVDNELQKSVVPVMNAQTEILRKITETGEHTKDALIKLTTIAEERGKRR